MNEEERLKEENHELKVENFELKRLVVDLHSNEVGSSHKEIKTFNIAVDVYSFGKNAKEQGEHFLNDIVPLIHEVADEHCLFCKVNLLKKSVG